MSLWKWQNPYRQTEDDQKGREDHYTLKYRSTVPHMQVTDQQQIDSKLSSCFLMLRAIPGAFYSLLAHLATAG